MELPPGAVCNGGAASRAAAHPAVAFVPAARPRTYFSDMRGKGGKPSVQPDAINLQHIREAGRLLGSETGIPREGEQFI